MASKSKSTITNVNVDPKFNTVYVYYSTGTEKMYPADKLPKTVAKWLAEHEATEEEPEVVEEVVEEEPEAVEDTVDQEVAQLPIPVDLPVIDTTTDEVVSTEAPETHREPVRQRQTSQPKSLALDIVDAVVSGLLMASRLSLIALAYLLMGLATTCQVVGDAVEWMTPRAASLIDRSRAVWTDTVRPACRTAAVWMAEAVWYALI